MLKYTSCAKHTNKKAKAMEKMVVEEARLPAISFLELSFSSDLLSGSCAALLAFHLPC